jgi:PKD repeat protein
MLRSAVAATIGFTLVALAAPTALAQAFNDDFANAAVITSLPFFQFEDTAQATSDPTDPTDCLDTNNGSVWFAFTPPSDTTIEADTFGSSYNTVLSAWTGTQGALSLVACNDDFNGLLQSRITLQVTGGTTYYFMVALCCGTGQSGGGSLQFSADPFVPPNNDDFANAIPIPSLPSFDTVNLIAATTEPSEPSPSCVLLQNTAWYSFTPATTEFVAASSQQFGVGLGAYTGTSLTNLAEVGCGQIPFASQPVVFRAQANTTYYLQVGAWCCDGFGQVTLHLDVAPNPVAQFSFSPGDPSEFDTIEFRDGSFDPASQPIVSEAWDFGDGATGTGCCPTHQYARDGDYTVELTVTTSDGRTASTSQVVQVRTHDVAVVRIGVPKSGHVGQTITITAHVRDTRYPERVEVALFKSVPGGFEQVGSHTQSVPVRNRTTPFTVAYTISEADRSVGEVSFKAVATILDHRDARPADNELISPPMKVT